MENLSLHEIISELMDQCLAQSRHHRQCDAITDQEFLVQGIARTISPCTIGREFLQALREVEGREIHRATYFGALHSGRRRDMASEVETVLRRLLLFRMAAEKAIDHLGRFEELNGFDIWAFDGHFLKHPCHAERKKNGHYAPVGGIYAFDLRTGMAERVVTTDFDTNKVNELRAFKETFSTKTAKGMKKTIVVADKAYIDTQYWEQCKAMKHNGMYVITLMKENMKPEHEEDEDFDKGNPMNCGVKSVSRVTFKSGGIFRKIVFIDPETLSEYTYLTTVENVQPGLIAFLYLWRWKIEKLFDVFKNKSFPNDKNTVVAGQTPLKYSENQPLQPLVGIKSKK